MKKYIYNMKSDQAFMGPTHAISAIAAYFLLTVLAGPFLFTKVLGTQDLTVYLMSVVIVTGAALMPDLDASRSTIINTLGFAGVGLSKLMRSASKLVQSVIKGPRESVTEDPHRMLWHTGLSAVLAGLLVTALTSITYSFNIFGKDLTVGMLVITGLMYLSMKLIMATIFKKHYKRLGMAQRGLVSAASLALSFGLTTQLPSELSYSWVGAVFGIGWLLHLIAGDIFTPMGVPLLFPLKIRGKRWWRIRFPLTVQAGGDFEPILASLILLFVVVLGLFKVLPLFI